MKPIVRKIFAVFGLLFGALLLIMELRLGRERFGFEQGFWIIVGGLMILLSLSELASYRKQ